MILYLLIVIGSCHCNDLPSRIEVENSINRTINEVEELIRQNSTLPQLTRREIIDILFNITSKDLEAHQDKKSIEEARNIYKKALMVVLPYNEEDARERESIRDLYTRPPIVELIADPSNPQNLEAWKNKKLQASAAFARETQHDKQSLENLIATHAPEEDSSEESPPAQVRYKNHKETYSEERLRSNLSAKEMSDSAPIKFSFNLENLQKRPVYTEGSATKRPVYRGSSKDEDIYVVYSTSATTISPGRAEARKNVSMPNVGPEVTSRPSKYNENVLSADQWRYNAPTTQRITTLRKLPDAPFKIRDKQPAVQTTPAPESLASTTPISKINHIPEISRVTSEKTPIVDAEQSFSIYVTPMSSSLTFTPSPSPSPSSEKSKYNSTYNQNSGGFRRITTTTTTMRPEVMELLASIGLRPKNATNVEDVFKKSAEDLEKKSQIPNSNGFVYTTFGLSAAAPDLPSITAQNTFDSPVSEIGKGMNNLTPDVQLLFQRFGLQTSNMVGITTSAPKTTVNTNSYTNFKPLPTSKIKNEDMKEFLARFGLGVGDSRQKKAMPGTTARPSLIEAVPDSMRQILENIGLISPKRTTPKSVEPTKTANVHIFKPHEVRVKDEGQRMKINELLDKIRLVQEGKASAQDVRKVADDLLASTKTLRDGPDPLNLEEIVKVYDEDVKNEVKRQQKPEETVEIATDNGRALANTTTAATGIKRFMISVLGTSEIWVGRIIQGLERIRRMLTNVGDRTSQLN